MTRAAATFKKRDVARAYRAVVDSGGQVSRVEIDRDGRIVVILGEPGEQRRPLTELDAWMAKRDAR